MQQRDNGGVRVAFNGIEDAENNTLLKLDEESNTASGLGIEILDGNMRPVKLNDLHAGMQWIPLVPEQNNILNRPRVSLESVLSVNSGCQIIVSDGSIISFFLLLPEEYGPAFPAIVDCYTSPPTLVWPVPLLHGFSSSYGVLPPLCKDH